MPPKEQQPEGKERRINVNLPPGKDLKDFLTALANEWELHEPSFIALLVKNLYEASQGVKQLEDTALWTVLQPILRRQGYIVVKPAMMQQIASLLSMLPTEQQQQFSNLAQSPISQPITYQEPRRQESPRQSWQETQETSKDDEEEDEGPDLSVLEGF